MIYFHAILIRAQCCAGWDLCGEGSQRTIAQWFAGTPTSTGVAWSGFPQPHRLDMGMGSGI